MWLGVASMIGVLHSSRKHENEQEYTYDNRKSPCWMCIIYCKVYLEVRHMIYKHPGFKNTIESVHEVVINI